MRGTTRRPLRPHFLSYRILAPLAAALVVLTFAGRAAAADDDVPNGRLGYRWTPEPPKQGFAEPDPTTMKIAKIGGCSIAGLWLLRKLMGSSE